MLAHPTALGREGASDGNTIMTHAAVARLALQSSARETPPVRGRSGAIGTVFETLGARLLARDPCRCLLVGQAGGRQTVSGQAASRGPAAWMDGGRAYVSQRTAQRVAGGACCTRGGAWHIQILCPPANTIRKSWTPPLGSDLLWLLVVAPGACTPLAPTVAETAATCAAAGAKKGPREIGQQIGSRVLFPRLK